MKKRILSFMTLCLFAGSLVLTGCGAKEETTQSTGNTVENKDEAKTEDKDTNESTDTVVSGLEDGFYFAQGDAYDDNGWKDVVDFTVEDGKITSVNWNTVNADGQGDKKTLSKEGKYPMVEKGGAKAEWFEQAKLAEEFIIESQSVEGVDAVAGVSMHVSGFFATLEKAKANGPTEKGPYTDGSHYAEEAAFSEKSGYKGTMNIKVIDGYIVAVNWNAVNKDGQDKKTLSIDGEYGMVAKGGAQAEWHEQAAKIEAHLIATQSTDTVDAIAGASIGLDPFFNLVVEALK